MRQYNDAVAFAEMARIHRKIRNGTVTLIEKEQYRFLLRQEQLRMDTSPEAHLGGFTWHGAYASTLSSGVGWGRVPYANSSHFGAPAPSFLFREKHNIGSPPRLDPHHFFSMQSPSTTELSYHRPEYMTHARSTALENLKEKSVQASNLLPKKSYHIRLIAPTMESPLLQTFEEPNNGDSGAKRLYAPVPLWEKKSTKKPRVSAPSTPPSRSPHFAGILPYSKTPSPSSHSSSFSPFPPNKSDSGAKRLYAPVPLWEKKSTKKPRVSAPSTPASRSPLLAGILPHSKTPSPSSHPSSPFPPKIDPAPFMRAMKATQASREQQKKLFNFVTIPHPGSKGRSAFDSCKKNKEKIDTSPPQKAAPKLSPSASPSSREEGSSRARRLAETECASKMLHQTLPTALLQKDGESNTIISTTHLLRRIGNPRRRVIHEMLRDQNQKIIKEMKKQALSFSRTSPDTRLKPVLSPGVVAATSK